MKKLNKFLCLLLSLCFIASFLGCGEKSKNATEESVVLEEKAQVSEVVEEIQEKEISPEAYLEKAIAIEDFFNLDYTPYLPEANFTSENVTSFTSSIKDISSSVSTTATNTESVIPGLRKTGEYLTKYNTAKPISTDSVYENQTQTGYQNNSSLENISPSDSAPLTVVTWGPQGELPAAVRNPEFYVMFSEPIVPLAALGKPQTSSDIIEITPHLDGTYRWNGTSLYTFIPSEAVNPQTVYTVKVLDSVKSVEGKAISGQKEFSTTASPLKIKNTYIGFNYSRKNNLYFSSSEVPPMAATELRVQFNYIVNANEIAAKSVITVGSKNATFTVVQEKADTVTYHINQIIPPETRVSLTVDGTAKTSYSTVSAFKYRYESVSASHGKYSNPVKLYFNHPLDSVTILENVSTSLDYKLTRENIEINNSTLTIYGLPVTFKSTYTIYLSKNLKDIYGRNLVKDISVDITVPNAEATVNFLESGMNILEAKYPHRLAFVYQNIVNGIYTVEKTLNPLDSWTSFENFENQDNLQNLATEPENVRIYQAIDFDDYLSNGKGMVRFKAQVTVPRSVTSDKTYTRENETTVQVTDLGVTVRYAVNKTLALVTRLSDGSPVPNAKVYLYNGYDGTTSIEEVMTGGQYFAEGTTNNEGLAIIEYEPTKAVQWFSQRYHKEAILVATEDDCVTFYPTSHYTNRNGVGNRYPEYALDQEEMVFMFTDRGLYKPGETVTFRGIDRTKQLGTFTPYTGNATITIKDNSWRYATVYTTIETTTSQSGGFYGSFTLPEDIEPGTYVIEYERNVSNSTHREYFTVAYFERLKFQTSVEMPQTQIIAGNPISANLKASYLAGGVLSSASYDAYWNKESWYFSTNDLAFKGYKFGPVNSYDSRSYINEESGTLNAEGFARLSCETTDNSIKGVPYRYRVSANVTDASNQMISTSGAVVVHPASFYLGLSKAVGAGFAKKDVQLDFNYKLALTDGTEAKNLSSIAGKDKKLNITLEKEEWNYVQQQGINGNVYTRYEKEIVEEYSATVPLNLSGKVSITPKGVGYYTLRLSTTDSEGRDVITEFYFFSTGSTKSYVMGSSSTDIKLTPDQNQYNPGDTATLLLESPLPKGNYLITVEREGIFTEELRYIDSNVTTIDIPIARNYLPVCYVSVSSYSVRTEEPSHEFGETDLDKPKGYYGVTALHVNPMVKAFSIDIESEKLAYKPGEEATIKVRATKGGQPLANAEITLMAVDRGVLDLIDYHVPNPIDFFYDEYNFQLHVRGGDSRAYLMDPVTYEIKNLAGGDAEETSDDKLNERKDFNPTALFVPELITDEEGYATVTFKVPDTLTTYRVTAFGVNGELLALSEDEFAVNNPINVQQVLPRRLRIRDTSELGVILTNLDSIPHEVNVALSMISPTEIAAENGVTKLPGKAQVDGANEHTVTVLPGKTISVYFDVTAEKAGVVNAEFLVKSDILNEKLICPLTIEKPYLFETVTTTGTVNKDEMSETEYVIIPSFAEEGLGSISVTLDATRLGPLGSAVNYLFSYPYGCIEQRASKLLPLVTFEEYIDVFNMDLSEKITDIKSLVKSYFSEIKNYQLPNGGYGYWSTSSKANIYASSRVAHVYAIALERGYSPSDLPINIERLTTYLKEVVNSKDKYGYVYSNYQRAYTNYVLALNNPEKVSISNLKSLMSESEDFAVHSYIGLTALEIAKVNPEAKDIVNQVKTYLLQFMRPETRGVDITNPLNSSRYYTFYNEKTEFYALATSFFVQLNPEDEMVTKLIYSLLKTQQNGYWTNTVTTGNVISAFYQVIKSSDLDNLYLSATASLAATNLTHGTFEGPAAKPVKETISFNEAKLSGIKAGELLPLTFAKNGNGALYYTASLSYALPEELQIPREEGISVTYRLFDDKTGEEIFYESSDSTLMELESGKVYRMEIKVSSTHNRDYVALRAPIPSGAEILDATFVTSPENTNNASDRAYFSDDYDEYYGGMYSYYHIMDNQTILDNEIQFFWDYFGLGSTTATFKFRATRRGVFPTPPVSVECMYEPEVFGRTSGTLYTIK